MDYFKDYEPDFIAEARSGWDVYDLPEEDRAPLEDYEEIEAASPVVQFDLEDYNA